MKMKYPSFFSIEGSELETDVTEELGIESAEETGDEICEESCEETGEEFIMEEEVEPGSETGLPEQPMQKSIESKETMKRRIKFFI